MHYLIFAILTLTSSHSSALCIDGDCQNGLGTASIDGTDYTGEFFDGEITGFALSVGSNRYCEFNMAVGETAGIRHCYLLDSQTHTLGKSYKGETKGGLVTIDRRGKILSYEIYEDGKLQSNFFPSQRVKEARLKQDLRDMLSELGQIRARRPEGIQDWMPLELKRVPGQEVPRYNRTKKPRSSLRANRSGKSGRPPSDSGKNNLQRLASIAAELNSNRRQVNADYKLSRVYVDPANFELKYEFMASKSVAALDRRILRISGETAYCRASKLELFREEGMPARWIYLDRDGEKLEFLTKPSNCS